MKMESLRDLFVEELKDLYSAENQIVKALPKMAKAATSPQLRTAFEQHLEQTKTHIERLETVCKSIGESPKGKACKGMEGLLEEGEELIKEKPAPEVLDAGLIAAAQRVEHYEMAGYGTARTYAYELGEQQSAALLQQTLDEETRTDQKLTQIAESRVNKTAAAA